MLHEAPLTQQRPITAEVAEFEITDERAAATIVGMAIHELDMMPLSDQFRNEVAMLTTNRQVEDRQIRLVDGRDVQGWSQLRVYMKLHNWAELYDQFGGNSATDKNYMFDVTMDTHSDDHTKARWMRHKDTRIALIYSDLSLTTDGLVELVVPFDDHTPREAAAQQIDETLRILTGEGLWHQADATASLSGWKTDKYRAYHKLPDGPLTPEQQVEAQKLQVVRKADDHYSLVAPGQHQKYEMDLHPGERIVPTHYTRRIEDAVNTIVDGQLNASLLRSETSRGRLGYANRADMDGGGGDSVYAYAHTLEQAEGPSVDMRAEFVLKPTILDRIDVRAYDTDAYGTREVPFMTPIDKVLGRDKTEHSQSGLRTSKPNYDSRLNPVDFSKGVAQLCFEGSVSMKECDSLVMPRADDAGSFHDFNWSKILLPYADKNHRYGASSHAHTLTQKLEKQWITAAEALSALTTLGMDERQAAYYTIGMNSSPRDRVIARLKYRGVQEVAGKPVELFVKERGARA